MAKKVNNSKQVISKKERHTPGIQLSLFENGSEEIIGDHNFSQLPQAQDGEDSKRKS